jgi:O-antigen chain-terminating methyltransferase
VLPCRQDLASNNLQYLPGLKMSDAEQVNNIQADRLYRAFEDKYRGSRALIKSRLRVYLPFITPLKSAASTIRAVDLGCGRGEWLELLVETGFEAHGVDLDEAMLTDCRERRLPVSQADAVDFLRSLPDASQLVVSGFHIAEHLPFQQLRMLVQEASRVLSPGGLLILETPNPENLKVAGTSFYLDPTHQRPLPPGLLSFLPQYYGFARVKVIRLQESPELLKSTSSTLSDVLGGVSPDYAVVAQKAGDQVFMDLANGAFNTEYGITIDELTSRFDRTIMKHTEQLTEQSDQISRQGEQIAVQAQATKEVSNTLSYLSRILERDLAATRKALDTRDAEISLLRQHVTEMDAVRQELAAVYRSTSWQATAPLRFISRTSRWIIRGMWAWLTLKPGSRPRRTAKRILIHVPVLREHWTGPASPPTENSRHQSAPEPRASEVARQPISNATRSLSATWQVDLSVESEGARRVYRRLVRARRAELRQ